MEQVPSAFTRSLKSRRFRVTPSTSGPLRERSRPSRMIVSAIDQVLEHPESRPLPWYCPVQVGSPLQENEIFAPPPWLSVAVTVPATRVESGVEGTEFALKTPGSEKGRPLSSTPVEVMVPLLPSQVPLYGTTTS